MDTTDVRVISAPFGGGVRLIREMRQWQKLQRQLDDADESAHFAALSRVREHERQFVITFQVDSVVMGEVQKPQISEKWVTPHSLTLHADGSVEFVGYRRKGLTDCYTSMEWTVWHTLVIHPSGEIAYIMRTD